MAQLLELCLVLQEVITNSIGLAEHVDASNGCRFFEKVGMGEYALGRDTALGVKDKKSLEQIVAVRGQKGRVEAIPKTILVGVDSEVLVLGQGGKAGPDFFGGGTGNLKNFVDLFGFVISVEQNTPSH
jgi:hypothetical protein